MSCPSPSRLNRMGDVRREGKSSTESPVFSSDTSTARRFLMSNSLGSTSTPKRSRQVIRMGRLNESRNVSKSSSAISRITSRGGACGQLRIPNPIATTSETTAIQKFGVLRSAKRRVVFLLVILFVGKKTGQAKQRDGYVYRCGSCHGRLSGPPAQPKRVLQTQRRRPPLQVRLASPLLHRAVGRAFPARDRAGPARVAVALAEGHPVNVTGRTAAVKTRSLARS